MNKEITNCEAQSRSNVPEYDNGNWHGWNGGECPVHSQSIVETVWRYKEGDLRTNKDCGVECSYIWQGNASGDIIAFRVIWSPPVSHKTQEIDIEKLLHGKDAVEVFNMSAQMWRDISKGQESPTFSRGDCRVWADRFEAAAILALPKVNTSFMERVKEQIRSGASVENIDLDSHILTDTFAAPATAQDDPQQWMDMTPEQKAALLLAHHEGKQIQFADWWEPRGWKWIDLQCIPPWHDTHRYRVKPNAAPATAQGVDGWSTEQIAEHLEMSARVSNANYETCAVMDAAAQRLRALGNKEASHDR